MQENGWIVHSKRVDIAADPAIAAIRILDACIGQSLKYIMGCAGKNNIDFRTKS